MSKAYIVCGPPGAGKSTYGKKLACLKKAVIIDIDTATERLVQHSLSVQRLDKDDRDSPHFKDSFRLLIYEQMFDLALENLVINNVVIVGPFTKELQIPNWPKLLSRRLNHPVEIHLVRCRPDIRRLRMIHRGNPRDLDKLRNWELHLSYYQNEPLPSFVHVLVDNSTDSPVLMEQKEQGS